MTADIAVSRELTSLQDELAATQRERLAAVVPPSVVPPAPSQPVDETREQRQLRDQLSQLISELGSSFEEAEKTVAAHPVQSVLGALLLGIVIGRLLGRR